MNRKVKQLDGFYGECGWDTINQFAVLVPDAMVRKFSQSFAVTGWDKGRAIVTTTFKALSGWSDYFGDMCNRSPEVYWVQS